MHTTYTHTQLLQALLSYQTSGKVQNLGRSMPMHTHTHTWACPYPNAIFMRTHHTHKCMHIHTLTHFLHQWAVLTTPVTNNTWCVRKKGEGAFNGVTGTAVDVGTVPCQTAATAAAQLVPEQWPVPLCSRRSWCRCPHPCCRGWCHTAGTSLFRSDDACEKMLFSLCCPPLPHTT